MMDENYEQERLFLLLKLEENAKKGKEHGLLHEEAQRWLKTAFLTAIQQERKLDRERILTKAIRKVKMTYPECFKYGVVGLKR